MTTLLASLLDMHDVDGCCAYWAKVAPNMPQPQTRLEAEVVMHRACTEARSVSMRSRAYSHRWLIERHYESGLPNELRPKAEQICPIKALGVGISVNFKNEFMAPAGELVRGVMEHAVLDAEADGRLEDSHFVRGRMSEAKDREMRALFGSLALVGR